MQVEPRPRILVTEQIAEAGVVALRERADVDVDVDLALDRPALLERIGDYDALIVRSATQVDAQLIAAARRLRVVGRAGTGVDNVDVAAATARGILVANAPQSNMLSAAEHAVALLLALARNIPQAHAALVDGRWERSRFGGVEVADKSLAVLGFGRIGQLVAARARGLGMRVLAYDPFVSAERFRELGVAGATSIQEVLADADFVSLHLPSTPETRGIIGAELLAAMKPGVRIVNAARGTLVDTDALLAALDAGHVAGAALDVFETEPLTSSPLFGRPNVVVTPHLGASTREAQDRAGTIIAEQVAAALFGGTVENAVNVPVVSDADRRAVEPFVPLADRLGQVVSALHQGPLERIDVAYAGQITEHDTRLVTLAAVRGVLRQVDESVNLVNARSLAESRGIAVRETPTTAHNYTSLIRVATGPDVRIWGTTMGREHRTWMVRALGYDLEIELGEHMLFVLNDDRPGMIGMLGTILGEEGVNIANMNHSRDRVGGRALTAVHTDAPVPESAIRRLEDVAGLHRLRVVSIHG
jgi:D-3-phosphoglycerate dehydrogenase